MGERERETYGGRKELAFVLVEEVGMVVGGSEGRVKKIKVNDDDDDVCYGG